MFKRVKRRSKDMINSWVRSLARDSDKLVSNVANQATDSVPEMMSPAMPRSPEVDSAFRVLLREVPPPGSRIYGEVCKRSTNRP